MDKKIHSQVGGLSYDDILWKDINSFLLFLISSPLVESFFVFMKSPWSNQSFLRLEISFFAVSWREAFELKIFSFQINVCLGSFNLTTKESDATEK